MNPRLALSILAVLLLAVVAWVFGDQLWSARGATEPETQEQQDQRLRGDAEKPGEQRVEAEANRSELEDPAARKQPAELHTSIRGTFLTSRGVLPAGARASIHKMPKMPEGGVMGFYSLGMEASRSKKNSKAGRRAQEFQDLLSYSRPVQLAPLDRHGAFQLSNPAPGNYLVQIDHPHLVNARKVEVEVKRGDHHDVGAIPTRLAGSLLVLVSDPKGQPVQGAHLELSKKMDMSRFMKPNAAADIMGMMRDVVPQHGRTDALGSFLFRSLETDSPLTLEVNADGLVEHRQPVRVLPGRERLLRVELAAGATLRVTVLDPEGNPVEKARVSLRFPEVKVAALLPGFAQPEGGSVMTKTGHTGADGVANIRGLPAGLVEIEAGITGFLRARSKTRLEPAGSAQASLRLSRGAVITGRVIDAESDSGLATARVKPTALTGFSIMGMGFGDIIDDVQSIEVLRTGMKVKEDGSFELGGLEPNESVLLMAVAEGFDAGKSRKVRAGTTGVEIRLQRRAQLTGRVLDSKGEPLTTYRVRLQKKSFMILDVPVATEDVEDSEDGSFLVQDVPRGRFKVLVQARGFADWNQNVSFRKGGKVDLGEIRMELPAAIEGVVQDPQGNPVAGAKIRAGRGGPSDMLVMAQVMGQKVIKTDEQGRFRLENVVGRKVRVLADKAGYAPHRSKPFEVRKGQTISGVVLRLSSGGSIHGVLKDADGKPIPNWYAQAQHSDGLGMNSAQTDANGEFTMKGMAPGTHKVDCMPMDYMERSGTMKASMFAGRGLDKGFDLGKMITGIMKYVVSDRVVVREGETAELQMTFHQPEDVTGKGLVDVHGKVRVGGRDLDQGMVFAFEAGSTVPNRIATVRRGSFELSGMRPGSYRLQARGGMFSGHLGKPKQVVIPQKSPFLVTMDLPAGKLSGKVVFAEDGKPAPGVVLSLHDASARLANMDKMDFGEGTLVTDNDGGFSFDGLSAGAYDVVGKQLQVLGGSGQSGRLSGLLLGESEQREGLILRLEKGASVKVTVTDGAGPRSNALVTLLSADGKPFDLFHRALTKLDGTVVLRGIPAGDYRVVADAPMAAPAVSDVVKVSSGGSERIELKLTSGIPVQVTFAGNEPEKHAGESLLYSVWRDGILVRAGRLTVPQNLASLQSSLGGIPLGSYTPGHYKLRIEGPRLGIREFERDLPKTGKANFTLK